MSIVDHSIKNVVVFSIIYDKKDFQILVGIFIFGGSSFFYTRFIIYEKLEEGSKYMYNKDLKIFFKCFMLIVK